MAGKRKSTFQMIKRAAFPALAILIIANFVGYAIIGRNGIFSWGDYRREKAERTVELAKLKEERARLEHRSKLLDPNKADPDLADEMVRNGLGVVRPDEVIVPIEQ